MPIQLPLQLPASTMLRMPVFRLLLLFLFCGIITSAWSSALPTHLTDTLTNTLTERPLWNPRHHFSSFLSAARTSLSTASRAGYTLDECETDIDCNGDRRCFNIGTKFIQLCAVEDDCECGPSDGLFVACTDSLKCDEGETCVENNPPDIPSCVSSETARRRGYKVVFSPPGDGYTLDICSDTSDCKGSRKCVLSSDPGEPCEDRDPCFCFLNPLEKCCPGECIPQEVCVQNTEVESPPFCASPLELERREDLQSANCSSESPSPTSSPTSDSTPTSTSTLSPSPSTQSPSPTPTPTSSPLPPVETDPPRPLPCISTHLLEHLPDSELLFKKRAWSKVLCDAQMSCATPGHVIVFKGRTMMMGSYCKIVGCNGRVMQVNSPRYRKKHRVRSMTEGLEFTVFAARYETVVEEHVIALAVKMGF